MAAPPAPAMPPRDLRRGGSAKDRRIGPGRSPQIVGADPNPVLDIDEPAAGGTLSPAPVTRVITDPTSGPMNSSQQMASKSGDRSLVLLVDDCAENREMYAEFLADEFRIAQAGDGYEALEMALAIIPDLVVMDLMLPGMSGAEVSHRLKRDTRTADMPVSGPLRAATGRRRGGVPCGMGRVLDEAMPPRHPRRRNTTNTRQ